MKKILTFMVLTVAAVLLFLLAAAPIINDGISEKTANELAALPLPDDTEFIEAVHKAGKLVGNGNGMQYFGAILIKSGLSMEELKEHYSNFAENEWECVVERQTEADIKIIEHGPLAFKTEIAGDGYYIVYSWGDNNTVFHGLDIRGH